MPVDINRSLKLLGAIPVRISPRAKYIPGATPVTSGAKVETVTPSVNVMICSEVEARAPHIRREVFRSNITYTNNSDVLTVKNKESVEYTLKSLLNEGYRWEKCEIIKKTGLLGKKRNVREEIYYTKYSARIVVGNEHYNSGNMVFFDEGYAYLHNGKCYAVKPKDLFSSLFDIGQPRISERLESYIVTYGLGDYEIKKTIFDSYTLDNVWVRDVYDSLARSFNFEIEWEDDDRTAVFWFNEHERGITPSREENVTVKPNGGSNLNMSELDNTVDVFISVPGKISEKGIAFLFEGEGFKECPYVGTDTAQINIGYGNAFLNGVRRYDQYLTDDERNAIKAANGKTNVELWNRKLMRKIREDLHSKYGDLIKISDDWLSKDEAIGLARVRINDEFADAVNKFLSYEENASVRITQNQFDALVSFVYNHGGNYLTNRDDSEAGDTMRTFLRDGDYSEEATYAAFTTYNKEPRLLNRRMREAALFCKGTY